MKLNLEENSKTRAVKDILRIYYDPKLYINEKKYKLETVKSLYELDFYEKNESIFDKSC